MIRAAGARNTRIKFEKPVSEDDGGGGRDVVWQSIITARCFVERVRSLTREVERVNAGEISASPTVRIYAARNSFTLQVDGSCRAVNLDSGETMNISVSQPTEEDPRRELMMTAVITEHV